MLTVRLLGQFALHQDNQPVELVSRPAQSLFAYLILNTGTVYRREKLAGLFWPDSTEANARSNLRHALWRIRKGIGNAYLQTDKLTVTFAPDSSYWLDTDVLTVGVTQNTSVDVLETSVSVYSGELLPGFYDEWVLLERELLRAVYDQRMQQLLDKLVELKQWPDCLTWAGRWIANGDVPEPAYRALMLAHAALGDQVSVAIIYQRCVEALSEDLGVEPSVETQELYQRLSQSRDLAVDVEALTETIEKAVTVISGQDKYLQAEDTIFVGRKGQLAQLDTFLETALTGQGQVAMVTGGAGRGKTSLLKAFARHAHGGSDGLSVASGQCHAYMGVGDPFLPFLHVMAMLTDTAKTRWLADALTQEHAFEQYVEVLHAQADRRPLLIILDDLQWADAASINLLFHLSRRIDNKRILIVGAYRPDEVAQGRDGERHPLEKVLSELKRNFGNIWVELGQASSGDEGQAFVNALLDTEPNQLGEGFRQALFRQTAGNPLFTIELLREMQARGDLVLNEDSEWVEGPKLDWWRLPVQVEGVIEERINRLEPDLRELLAVASVEGEHFTAQVIAQVQGMNQRQLLQQLSQELQKRHCLVWEQEEIKVGRRSFSRYQFSHVLFHHYLYHNLAMGERRLLHGEIGQALEAFYVGQTEEIAAQLAHHFCEAGEYTKAIEYARQAANRAQALYAYDEAAQHFQAALSLLEPDEQNEKKLALLEKLADVYVLAAKNTQALSLYQTGLELCPNLENVDEMNAVRLHRKILELADDRFENISYESHNASSQTREASRAYLETSLSQGRHELPPLEQVRVLTMLATSYKYMEIHRIPSLLDKAEEYAQAAVALAEQLDVTVELSDALGILAEILLVRGLLTEQMEVSHRRLALSRDPRFKDVLKQIDILEGIYHALIASGEYAQALPYLREAESLASNIKSANRQAWMLNFQAFCWYQLDRWEELAEVDRRRQALEEFYTRKQLGGVCWEIAVASAGRARQGDFEQANVLREQAEAHMEYLAGKSPENWSRTMFY